ncbi:MAG: energy transducer TonB [Epsilonproteobacteria bacterium]|nr:energy transducer TonB [Campylobacterota bacterium]
MEKVARREAPKVEEKGRGPQREDNGTRRLVEQERVAERSEGREVSQRRKKMEGRKRRVEKRRVVRRKRRKVQKGEGAPGEVPSLATLFAAPPPKGPSGTVEELPREYRKLYRDEFESYTEGQRRFLKENLSRIGAITQKYLSLRGYPSISVKTRQQGINVVEFYLHPNGDISGLKIIGSSGYEALDENSLETVRTAYKDYPLPKEKTKIRIYVEYRLIF